MSKGYLLDESPPSRRGIEFGEQLMDLQGLYQDLILDHNRHPRNYGPHDQATHQAHGHNPLCGDEITVYLQIRDNILASVQFEGQGCAIAKASASLMTEALKGQSEDIFRAKFKAFHDMLIQENPTQDDLGKLAAFEGVKKYPLRVKCATLAWHTALAALDNPNQTISTER